MLISKINDLTGQHFGRLEVLYRVESKNGNAYWHCKCECGKEKDICGYSLTKGLTSSCGCLQKEKTSKIKKKDISNQKFGKLTALEPTEERKFGFIVWKCQCDCGNIHYVTTNALLQNQIQSCGKCISHNSLGEEKIKELLTDANIIFETEKTFEDCFFTTKKAKSRFDFYVNNSYLIEYDGKQHFIKDTGFGSELELIQQRDEYKNNYCKENNIPLIRIPYTHYDNLCLDDLILEKTKFRII